MAFPFLSFNGVIIGRVLPFQFPVFRREFPEIVFNFPAVVAAFLIEHEHGFFPVSVSGVFYE
jgi:hypothetical protein